MRSTTSLPCRYEKGPVSRLRTANNSETDCSSAVCFVFVDLLKVSFFRKARIALEGQKPMEKTPPQLIPSFFGPVLQVPLGETLGLKKKEVSLFLVLLNVFL